MFICLWHDSFNYVICSVFHHSSMCVWPDYSSKYSVTWRINLRQDSFIHVIDSFIHVIDSFIHVICINLRHDSFIHVILYYMNEWVLLYIVIFSYVWHRSDAFRTKAESCRKLQYLSENITIYDRTHSFM